MVRLNKKATGRPRSSASRTVGSPIFDWPTVVKHVSYRSPRTQPNGILYFNRSVRCQAPGSFKAHTRSTVTEADDDDDDDNNIGFDGESILSNDNDSNWDDDATLMALLDDPEELVDNDRTAVVDRLEPVFSSRRAQEKEYTKQVFLRAIQNTKHIHAAVEEGISIRFLQAVSLFDNKSRYAEEAGRRGQQGASTSYDEAKKSLIELFNELQALAAEDKAQFQSLKETIGSFVRQLRQRATELHDDVERLISILDKKARQLGAEDDAKAKEKLLRGILEKY